MTTEMTMPRRGAGPGGVRLRAAIAAAFVLARFKPGRLRRVLTRCARGARPATYEETLEAYEAVTATSRRCAGRYGCLPRSVAIALVCRMAGSWPDWCAGSGRHRRSRRMLGWRRRAARSASRRSRPICVL